MEILIASLSALSTLSFSTFKSTISSIGIVVILIQLEINLITNFMAFIDISNDIDDLIGELFGFYILVLGACETAIGLSLLVSYYKLASHLNINL